MTGPTGPAGTGGTGVTGPTGPEGGGTGETGPTGENGVDGANTRRWNAAVGVTGGVSAGQFDAFLLVLYIHKTDLSSVDASGWLEQITTNSLVQFTDTYIPSTFSVVRITSP